MYESMAAFQSMLEGGARRVMVGGGESAITLSLPGLLDPAGPATTRAWGQPDPRANERVHAEIGRVLRDAKFESLDEANAALGERFTGSMDAIPSTASTPLERAQDLACQAFDAVGRRRIVLARRALELSPDCADAYVVLAEFAATPEQALPLYEAGVAAGERALGAAVAAQEESGYWQRVETRPYMRARFGLGETLAMQGRHDEAIVQFRALLRLNPTDNQGARYPLLGALVRVGRSEDAFSLLDRYPEDAAADWMFTWALLEFRAGRAAEADVRLADALGWNEHVPRILSIPPDELAKGGGMIAMGGVDEAVEYANNFGDLWRDTDGALQWVAKAERRMASPRRGPGGSKGRRAGRGSGRNKTRSR